MFIENLENLTYCTRLKEIIKLGKKEKKDSNIVSLIDNLQAGNYYERLLALYSCYGSYNGERVLTAIKSNFRSIRNKALDLISIVGSDAQVLNALEIVNFKQRFILFRYLRKRKRLAVIDSYLTKLIEQKDARMARLLIYGTAEIVNCHLERILDRAGQQEWTTLAKLHPDITINALEKYGVTATEKDWQFVYYFNTVISRLAELCPERTLNLIQNLVNHPSYTNLSFQELVYFHPVEVAKLVIQSPDKIRINLNSVAHKLPQDLLIRLITSQEHTVNNYTSWLPKLKPEQRVGIYEHCHRGWRDKDGCLSIDLIKLFPTAIREKEARYHLQLPLLTTRPYQSIPYAALLPWDETREVIQPYLKNPDADLRILALKTLIDATRYYRSRLSDLLTIIRNRNNEQDPVRNAMLNGLANLPPSIWKQEYLTDLGEILTDTLKAADLSRATASHAQRIVIIILPFHPQWAAEWLAILVQNRGTINFYNLETRLNNSQVEQLAPILLPVLKSWETREREWNIIESAASLGKRLKVFDGLVDILERLLHAHHDKGNAPARILTILSEHRRDRFAFLIPQLLIQDKSWFTQPVVNQYLHNVRQDLLTPFLGQNAYKGKFSTGQTRFVPYFSRGFCRWTFQQQTIYAKSLDELTRDEKRDAPTVWSTVEQLSLLPAIEPTSLIQLASLENPQLAVRDRALRALAQLDGGQGIPVLLEALKDTRTRIAIYALRSCLMEMPVDNAISILKNAVWEKIIVAKEIVRLLGDLDSDTAYQELLTWNERDLHRDVRIALLRALWEHLEKEETWNILEQAANSPDEAVATMVGRTPEDRLSEKAQTRLISLLIILLNRPEPTLRLTILQRCYQLPVKDTKRGLLPQLLKAMNSAYTDEVSAAANALFATYRDAEIIGGTIKNIIPNRRNLSLVLETLENRLSNRREEFLPIVRAILLVLDIDPLTTSQRIKLAVKSLPYQELTQFFITLNNRGELHADALFIATNTLNFISKYRQNNIYEISDLETTLAASKDEKLRRIAIAALIAQTDSYLGWNQKRLARLLNYRQDASVLVAAAAQFIFPPDKIID